MSGIKDHPFAVEAFFESSLVLTYAIPAAVLRPMVPARFELDVFLDKWAFAAIAIVKAKHLRPRGLPAFMGNDFVLAGYRVFVRYTTSNGKNLRGLYILKSETDKRKMAFLGNLFTHYRYTTTDISHTHDDNILTVRSARSGLHIVAGIRSAEAALPAGSPFSSWKEARRFAGPLPFTFTYNADNKKILIIEGVRENWKPMPVNVINYKFSFIDNLKLNGVTLANAFMIRNIPYYWKRGKIEHWK